MDIVAGINRAKGRKIQSGAEAHALHVLARKLNPTAQTNAKRMECAVFSGAVVLRVAASRESAADFLCNQAKQVPKCPEPS